MKVLKPTDTASVELQSATGANSWVRLFRSPRTLCSVPQTLVRSLAVPTQTYHYLNSRHGLIQGVQSLTPCTAHNKPTRYFRRWPVSCSSLNTLITHGLHACMHACEPHSMAQRGLAMLGSLLERCTSFLDLAYSPRFTGSQDGWWTPQDVTHCEIPEICQNKFSLTVSVLAI
jgi:hypothetical protein